MGDYLLTMVKLLLLDLGLDLQSIMCHLVGVLSVLYDLSVLFLQGNLKIEWS